MDTDPKPSNVSDKPEDGAQATGSGSDDAANQVETGAGGSAASDNQDGASADERHHTVYKILDEALSSSDAPEGGRAYVHPLLFDCLLACGLLLAMGGFTIGLLKIYITHSAEQSITQRNYRAAIAILRGAPFPGWFTVKGRDPQELLNQAMYLDAMDMLEENKDDPAAIAELTEIQPGSKYFELAQEIVKDHTKASEIQLEGHTEHEKANERVVEDNQLPLPEENDK